MAIHIFHRQVIVMKRMQPDNRVPNAATLQALAEAANPKALQRYASVDALFQELEEESCLEVREITIARRDAES